MVIINWFYFEGQRYVCPSPGNNSQTWLTICQTRLIRTNKLGQEPSCFYFSRHFQPDSALNSKNTTSAFSFSLWIFFYQIAPEFTSFYENIGYFCCWLSSVVGLVNDRVNMNIILQLLLMRNTKQRITSGLVIIFKKIQTYS